MATPQEDCGRRVRYDQRKNAIDAIARMVRGRYAAHGDLAVYKCPLHGCGGWHIESNRRKRKGFWERGKVRRREDKAS